MRSKRSLPTYAILILALLAAAVTVMTLWDGYQRLSEHARLEKYFSSDMPLPYVNTDAVTLHEKGAMPKEEWEDGVPLHIFTTPEGIDFASYSEAWDADALKELYNELLLNRHGEELYALSRVVVYPQEDEDAKASHTMAHIEQSLRINHPCVPDTVKFTLNDRMGVITLFEGDTRTTTAEMASSLSHEYGHHYTYYYMFPEYEVEGSRYLELRGLDESKLCYDMEDEGFYYDNHHWYPWEIAAEDYVLLMGSPNACEVTDHLDGMERLRAGEEQPRRWARNNSVQENLMIPTATELPALAEYFYSFIGESAPVFDVRKEMNISVKKYSPGYDLTTGYQTFVYYGVSWDKVYGEDAIYTLTVYDSGDFAHTVYPVRTVTAGEDALAYVGEVVITQGRTVSYFESDLCHGTKTFIVNVITPDKRMYTSCPLEYTFD